MTYPDYIKQFRPKGTVVKFSNGIYYAYYATSKRVPGKSYPVQEIKELAGKIDENGFHPIAQIPTNLDRLMVRECGFTNFLLKFEDEYVTHRSEVFKDRKDLYRSMIVYLSDSSYLCDNKGQKIYSAEEMVNIFHIAIPDQITAISKICGYDLKILEPLKYICNVRIGDHVYNSILTQAQKDLLDMIGITEDEIR